MNLRESARYDQVQAGKLLGGSGGGTVTLGGWMGGKSGLWPKSVRFRTFSSVCLALFVAALQARVTGVGVDNCSSIDRTS